MKPDFVLNELEREPIVYFGCTWTEIKNCLWRSAALVLPLTLALIILAPGMTVLGFVPGLLGWITLAYVYTQRIRKFRVGKPMYYERHRQRVRRPGAPYVRAGEVYQVMRSAPAPDVKRPSP